MKQFFLLAFFISLLFSQLPSTYAEENEPSSASQNRNNGTSVGFYTGKRSKIYKNGEVPINFLPIVSFNYDGFYLRGISLGYEWQNYSPKPYIDLTPNLLILKAKDDGYSEGLSTRNWTIMGGGGLDFYLPWRLILNPDIKVDILGRYNSGYATLKLKRNFFPTQKVMLGIAPFFRYYEKKYVDYYFGVHDNEVRSNRPGYKGKNAYEYGSSGSLMFFLGNRWALHFLGSYSWLSKEITDSPLVIRKNMYSLYVGVTKRI